MDTQYYKPPSTEGEKIQYALIAIEDRLKELTDVLERIANVMERTDHPAQQEEEQRDF